MTSNPMKFTIACPLVLLILLLTFLHCHAQSTAETAEGIKRELDGIKAEFVSTLQSAISNPENLESGQTKVNCEQILAKLESLQSRINETADLLAKREADVAAKTGLSEADKLELKQTLQNQKKPLDAYRKTANQLQSELKSLITSKIGEIHEIYKNFRDISGPEQATAKVEARMNEVLAPYLPPKPKPTPTPKPTPQATPTPPIREVPPRRNQAQNEDESVNQFQPSEANGRVLSFREALARAENDDAYAQAVVSIYYAIGYKTDKDTLKAADYAMRSAKQEHPLGAYRLASMVENGDGFDKDLELARNLKEAAFDGLNNMQGDPYAITALGIMLFRGEGGVRKNEAEAARLYRLAADMGYAPAQYNYSACLLFGKGVPKNKDLGIRYWKMACEQGYSIALKGMPQ
jgi:hypothetical protein